MTYNSKTISIFLLLLTTNLFGQDYDLLTQNEWMSTSKGFQKHYLFIFSDGKIKSEFSQSDWSKYILDNGELLVFNNDQTTYKEEYEQISKEMGIQGAPKADTAIFKIKRLDKDSIILEPTNLRARELSYWYNRRTFRLDSNSFKTNGPVKFYNRQLIYQKVQFDSLSLNHYDQTIIRIDSKGIYTIKQVTEGSKKKSQTKTMTSGQLDELCELLNESNLSYFKSPDKFEWRTNDRKGLKLKLTNKEESIKLSTDYNYVPRTIKPLIDFMVALSKE